MRYAAPVLLAVIRFALPLLVRRHRGGDVPSLTSQLLGNTGHVAIFTSIMWLHFHIKMWIPLINARRFDQLYQNMDMALAPLVTGMIAIRTLVADNWPNWSWLPGVDWWYMIVFLGPFFASFAYHLIAD